MSKSNDIIQSLIRASLGAKASSVADDQLEAYVAKLIAEEAAAKRRKYDSLGIVAYTQPESPKRSNRPNLGYLRNVLKQTESHNAVVLQELQAAATASSSAASSDSRPSSDSRNSVSLEEDRGIMSTRAQRARGRGSVKHTQSHPTSPDSSSLGLGSSQSKGSHRRSRHQDHSRSPSRSPSPKSNSPRREGHSQTHRHRNSPSTQSTRKSQPRDRSSSPHRDRDRVERRLRLREHSVRSESSPRKSSSNSRGQRGSSPISSRKQRERG